MDVAGSQHDLRRLFIRLCTCLLLPHPAVQTMNAVEWIQPGLSLTQSQLGSLFAHNNAYNCYQRCFTTY